MRHRILQKARSKVVYVPVDVLRLRQQSRAAIQARARPGRLSNPNSMKLEEICMFVTEGAGGRRACFLPGDGHDLNRELWERLWKSNSERR